eukprot:TRINITY_DN18087_c0_g1_i1.p1 TRINITY_DN18087_c0_g1~~TRINITY_DN18087_c0_g1_i1.p1  ORF type:complete len:246 (+),score=34.85 TRINITY_DN18087_c0_g1_i1:80-739(+)
MNEEKHKSNRKSETEKVKNNESITDKAQSAYNATKEGAKETKESMKKKYEEQKADNAKDDIKGDNEGIIESATNYVKDTASATTDYIKDTPEDIAPALKEATTLSWTSKTKLMLHFADAPCHGRNYHDLSGDDYPDGSPTGHDPIALLKMLYEFQIDYYFVKVGGNEDTNKMVELFRDEYNNNSKCLGKKVNFQEFDASDDPQKFLPIVATSISCSVTK